MVRLPGERFQARPEQLLAIPIGDHHPHHCVTFFGGQIHGMCVL
jgi:hypothetical protein